MQRYDGNARNEKTEKRAFLFLFILSFILNFVPGKQENGMSGMKLFKGEFNKKLDLLIAPQLKARTLPSVSSLDRRSRPKSLPMPSNMTLGVRTPPQGGVI
jgi:hypothetical protein